MIGRDATRWQYLKPQRQRRLGASSSPKPSAAHGLILDSYGIEDRRSLTRDDALRIYNSASILSIVVTSRSASVSEKGIGGLILVTLWKGPSVPSKIPHSRKRLEMNEASSAAGSSVSRSRTSSMPRNRPEPRTSPTIA